MHCIILHIPPAICLLQFPAGSACTSLKLGTISHFGLVQNGSFSTRCSLSLTHSLVGAKKFRQSKTKVFGSWKQVFNLLFYKKFMVSRGKTFGRSSQWAKHFSVQAHFWELKNSKLQIENLFSICFSVREKPPWQTNDTHFPEKPSSGRFFCCLCWIYQI